MQYHGNILYEVANVSVYINQCYATKTYFVLSRFVMAMGVARFTNIAATAQAIIFNRSRRMCVTLAKHHKESLLGCFKHWQLHLLIGVSLEIPCSLSSLQ